MQVQVLTLTHGEAGSCGESALCTPDELPIVRERIGLKGIPGALALGLVASQCATPVLAAILTYVMAKGALLYGVALFFVTALEQRPGGAGWHFYRRAKKLPKVGTLVGRD